MPSPKKPQTEIDHAFAIFDEETRRVLKDIRQQLGRQEIPVTPKPRQRRPNIVFNPFGG